MKEFIKDFPISKLIPYDRNPRINGKAADALAKSIKRVGNNDPIEVNGENVILCGHTRKKALEKLGITTTDIIRITGMTPEQEIEYRITNNKTGEIAEWDFEILDADFTVEDLSEMGFSEIDENIDFDNITSTEDREKAFKEQMVTCPACEKTFQVQI